MSLHSIDPFVKLACLDISICEATGKTYFGDTGHINDSVIDTSKISFYTKCNALHVRSTLYPPVTDNLANKIFLYVHGLSKYRDKDIDIISVSDRIKTMYEQCKGRALSFGEKTMLINAKINIIQIFENEQQVLQNQLQKCSCFNKRKINDKLRKLNENIQTINECTPKVSKAVKTADIVTTINNILQKCETVNLDPSISKKYLEFSIKDASDLLKAAKTLTSKARKSYRLDLNSKIQKVNAKIEIAREALKNKSIQKEAVGSIK